MKSKKISLLKGTTFIFLWMLSLSMFAQNITISGIVRDTDGESLVGVTVQIMGTTVGTVTDFEGRYELPNVPRNATLVVSYVGMQSVEVPVSGRSVF